MPTWHPDDALLAAHATGGAGEALSLLVVTHATLCATCRRTLEGLDAVGGALLDAHPRHEVSPDVLAATLARLDEPVAEAPPARDPSGLLPAALLARVGPLDAVAWRPIPGGIRFVELPVRLGHTPVRLLDLPPGLVVPPHAHTGVERILVLSGSFTDEVGRFARGDVSTREDASALHLQRIDDGERCLALVFSEGPLVPTTLRGHFLQWWSGL